MPSNLEARLRRTFSPDSLDTSLLGGMARRLWHSARSQPMGFPRSGPALVDSALYRGFWYYSIELMESHITSGIYKPDVPLLPRILLRHCDVREKDCLDLGSMEGLIPTLLCRRGARSVLATDATYHCYNKIAAVKHYHNVKFDFQQIGLMDNLSSKINTGSGFDFINLSGVLYHVFSPMHVLAGVRPLLKRNGIMVVSTNVALGDGFRMTFNAGGQLQSEQNTFWYPTPRLFEYMLRMFRLKPIDCRYHGYTARDDVRYVDGAETGYLAVVCRATDDVATPRSDAWAHGVDMASWEYNELCDKLALNARPGSTIAYDHAIDPYVASGAGDASIDLEAAIHSEHHAVREAQSPNESHQLLLSDIF